MDRSEEGRSRSGGRTLRKKRRVLTTIIVLSMCINFGGLAMATGSMLFMAIITVIVTLACLVSYWGMKH